MGDNDNQFNQWYQQNYASFSSTGAGFGQSGAASFPSTGAGFGQSGAASFPSTGGGFGQFSTPPGFGFSQFSPSPPPFQQFSTPPGGYCAADTPPDSYTSFRRINLNDDDDDVNQEEEEGEDTYEEDDEEEEEEPSPPRRKGKAPTASTVKAKRKPAATTAKSKGKATETSGAKSGGRGQNYTPDEIAFIARCYVDLGGDTKTGNYQTLKQFWNKIVSRFNEHFAPMMAREVGPIRSAFQRAKKDISKFNGGYISLERENASGRNDLDLYTLAEDAFTAQLGKEFKYRKAWEVLRQLPSFNNPSTKTQPKRTRINEEGDYTSNSSAAASANEATSTQIRPPGQRSSAAGKGKKAEVAHQLGELNNKMDTSNNISEMMVAYEIYTRKTTDMDPVQLERHKKFCAHLEKKYGF